MTTAVSSSHGSVRGRLPGVAAAKQLASTLRRAVALAWAASGWLIAVLAVLMLAGGLIPPAVAWMQRVVIDAFTGHAMSGGALTWWAAGLGVAGVLAVLLPYASSYVGGQFRRAVGLQVQDSLFQAVNSFPGLRRFESPEFMDKMQVAQNTSQSGLVNLINGSLNAVQALVSGAGLLVALWVVSPVLCLLVAASAGPAVMAQLALSRRGAELQWRLSPATRRQMFYRQLQTDLYAAKELRLFGASGFLRERMLTEIRSINRQQRALDRRTFLTQSGLAMISSAVTVGGLIWTVHEAWSGRLSVGDVSLFILASVGVQASLSSTITSIASSYQALLLFGHYLDIVSAEPDLPVTSNPSPVAELRREIEIRDVWFRYEAGQDWVLRGISMSIPAGTSAALIGLNGAGKSTLVKLLCRMYDPDRGVIRWDGVDIRDMRPEELRQRIGAVFQDYMAYALTAAENIGIGDLSRLNETDAISRAAIQAGIHQKLAALPLGYRTMLSRLYYDGTENAEAGVLLSGGQWQRVALARGLMRADRDLLILDEPNSGLDADAENALHQQMTELRAGRTSLLISQRLGAVRAADRIFVLSGGCIIEQGTHHELMTAEGEYHRLFTLQASGYVGNEAEGLELSTQGSP